MHVERARAPAFYVFGVASLSFFAASAVTGALAWSAHESVQSKCTGTGFCSDPSGIDDASRARTLAWVSTGALAAGAVAGVVALALPRRERLVAMPVNGGAAIAWVAPLPW